MSGDLPFVSCWTLRLFKYFDIRVCRSPAVLTNFSPDRDTREVRRLPEPGASGPQRHPARMHLQHRRLHSLRRPGLLRRALSRSPSPHPECRGAPDCHRTGPPNSALGLSIHSAYSYTHYSRFFTTGAGYLVFVAPRRIFGSENIVNAAAQNTKSGA